MAARGADGRFLPGAKGPQTNREGSKPKVTVELIGVDKLRATLERYGEEVTKRLRQELRLGAVLVQSEARRLILSSPKTGREYFDKDKRPNKHKASEPGNAPANWTGRLARGIQVSDSDFGLTTYVYSSAKSDDGEDYGAVLELGTKDGKIKKRPFLRPAFMKHKAAINKGIITAIQSAKPKKG